MPPLPVDHPDFTANDSKPKKYNHEHYSQAGIKFLFRDIIENHPLVQKDKINVDEVLLLLGDKTATRPKRTLMVLKALISGQIDADRADYLLRDSLHLGVNYGVYDRNRLINCITLCRDEAGDIFVAIEEGGWHVAESLVIARYQMFSQVYFHKVRRIYDFHVSKALPCVLNASELNSSMFPPPTSEANLQKYLEFDDWLVYGEFKNGNGGKHGKHILDRTHYKKIAEWGGDLTAKEKNKIKKYEDKYMTQGQDCYIDRIEMRQWYKPSEDIMICNNKTRIVAPLSIKSQIIKTLGQPTNTTRFYAERED